MEEISEVDIINARITELTETFLDGKMHKVGEVRAIQNEIRLLERKRERILRDPSRLRRIGLRLHRIFRFRR